MGLFDAIGNFFTGADDNKDYNAYTGMMGDVVGAVGQGAKPWLSNPGYTPAPLNSMQKQAASGAQGLFGQGSAGSYSGKMGGLFSNGMDTDVGVSDIMGFANPLADLMNERGMSQLQDSYGTASADTANRQAAMAGFSGSGSAAALERAALNDSMIDATKDMSLANEASAYGLGAGLATGNLDRGMQGLGLQLSGLSAADDARLAGMGFDAQSLGLLGAFGDQQQQYDQSVSDAPYTSAQRLFGMLNGYAPQEEASGFQTLLGTVLGSAQGVARAGKDIGWWGK